MLHGPRPGKPRRRAVPRDGHRQREKHGDDRFQRNAARMHDDFNWLFSAKKAPATICPAASGDRQMVAVTFVHEQLHHLNRQARGRREDAERGVRPPATHLMPSPSRLG
jgi:hypothetical protein